VYNHGGERVRKSGNVFSGPLTDRLFIYSESSQLLGEYAANGTAVAQYLWLGNMPIGVIQSGQVYAIHTDHLTTPRAVINSQGTTVWRWESLDQPFGESLADEDPDGDGVTFEFNLRFPGQYFDEETGLHYNYFRDYDPTTGRYIQSDPIGLDGGINTYAYVASSPLMLTDPEGLDYWVENADPSESGLGMHQSICVGTHTGVGKKNGSAYCISFGRKPGQKDCYFECDGHVYVDRSPSGPIDFPLFRKTSSQTDRKIKAKLQAMLRQPNRPWDVIGGENCRVFSQAVFWVLVNEYGGESWPNILMNGGL